MFGVTNIPSIFFLDIMLLAAIGIILTEIGDIIDAHIEGSYIFLAWIVGVILCFPAVLFFISKIVSLPQVLITSFPIMLASFLFVEGLSSFFIGQS